MWEKVVSAIEDSDSQLVAFYLTQDPYLVYEQNYQDETLLHFAAKRADLLTIIELVNRGARADTPDDFGWTPMHEACNNGNESAVALFIKTGINLNLKTRKKESPLHLATRHNFSGIMARLLEAGAMRDIDNKDGNTPLHLAAQNGFSKAMEVLLAAGASTAVMNLEGSTPLHLTAIHGHLQCADMLLSNHANPDQLDNSGKNFLDVAEIFGRNTFIIYLRTKFPSLNEDEAVKATLKMEAIPEKPNLKDFFDAGKTVATPAPKAVLVDSMVRGLVTGKKFCGHNHLLLKSFESVLWFAVFPMLLFILWKGFANNILPPIISLNLNFQNQAMVHFLQDLLNWLIVFMFSFQLVTTERPSLSWLHFFKDLRDSIHFRVLHFALIELHFYQSIVYNQEFFKDFILFWTWFVVLYSVSYLFWWASTHSVPDQKQSEGCLVQN